MKITYLSHSCFLIETAGKKILIDPFLTGNPKAEIKAGEIECDYIIITHAHDDHIGDAIPISKRTGATIIANFEIATYCGNLGANVHPMHIGGAFKFPFGKVKLTIAHHGSTITTENGPLTLGQPTGILITAENKTIYHAGDTGLFYDMKLIGEMHKPLVAILPIGDNFTMGIDDAVKALEFIKPSIVIPMHYDTFEIIEVDVNEFKTKAETTGCKAEILAIGKSLTL